MGAIIDSILGSKESVRARDVYRNKVEDVKHAINFLFMHFPIELGLFLHQDCKNDKELVIKKSQLWTVHVFGIGERFQTHLFVFILAFGSVSEDGMPQVLWRRIFTYSRGQWRSLGI